MRDALIIVPVYNEEKNIRKVTEDLKENIDFADILVINDSSTDDTLMVLNDINVEYISLPFNMGYSAALQSGFKYAVKHNYKYVIQFDGDGQHKASEIKKLYSQIIKSESDIVIGSRFKEQSEYNHSFFRKVGTYIFKKFIHITCNKDISDPTSGLQILSRKVFCRYSKAGLYPEFPDANLIIEMIYNGYKIEEVQVYMEERVFGISMHSGVVKPIKYMVKMMYSIIIICLKYKLCRSRKLCD
ncbi:MAG: glycosyltransferase family 2 protein [Bacillota bacterium]|nr:glycosyltransferase family 2 protein [Bacillota bacterium]